MAATKIDKVIANLFMRNSLIETSNMIGFWQSLQSQIISASKFDGTELAKRRFTKNSYEDAIDILASRHFLFIKNENSKFVALVDDHPSGVFNWTLRFNLKEFQTNSDRYIDWLLNELLANFSPIFGYVCTETEDEAKHGVLDNTGNPNFDEGIIGRTRTDMQSSIPGLYWLTLFGKELLDHLEFEKLQGIDEVIARTFGDNFVAVQLNEPVLCRDINTRMETERRIIELLGSDYFFDRRNSEDYHYAAIPTFNKLFKHAN